MVRGAVGNPGLCPSFLPSLPPLMPSSISASQRLAQLFVAAALATSSPGEGCTFGWPGGDSPAPVGQCEEASLFGAGGQLRDSSCPEDSLGEGRGEETEGTHALLLSGN
ncbi:Hypothetical predicted protein [Podarcis lilfordi]|uniref:Uncharacterized protein n=1 Tax=Podarcis lilfordi TaxID=74358 RepID=A0AA35LDV0_9SAUR|nr:Hypothetical predicted protein [Podarcis lilfordi]